MNSAPPPPDPDPTPEPPEEAPLGAVIDWADPNSPPPPLYMTAGGVVGVVVLGLALVVLAHGPLWHTDFWVHLKYGERIASERAIPDREPLSPFTDKEQRFFDAMWLSQVTYHGL